MALFLQLLTSIMSLSREARIGILVTISLIIFFTGFYFLKGSDLFSDDKVYYCYYNDVDGLLSSSPVEIRGLNVGHVNSFGLEGNKGVKVAISVHKSIAIPEGTMATITSDGLLGNKMIRLDLGNGTNALNAGATLSTSQEPGVVDNISDQMTPLIKSMRKTISALDTVIAGVNVIAGSENRQVITNTLKNIELTSSNLTSISNDLNKETGEIKSILHNTNSFTANLAKNNDTVQHMLSNLNMLSGQLSRAPLQQAITQLNATTEQLQGVLGKINNGQGSLGMMVNDKNLYTNLNSSLTTLQKLMADVNANPRRYVNVTMFGRKPKKEK